MATHPPTRELTWGFPSRAMATLSPWKRAYQHPPTKCPPLKKHLRVTQQRDGDAEPPPHAARVSARPHPHSLTQPNVLQQAGRLALALAGG